LPQKFSETVRQSEVSEKRYLELSRSRKTLRRTYMGMLLLLTVMVLLCYYLAGAFSVQAGDAPSGGAGGSTQEIPGEDSITR